MVARTKRSEARDARARPGRHTWRASRRSIETRPAPVGTRTGTDLEHRASERAREGPGRQIDSAGQHARLQSDNVDLQAANTELQNTIAGLQSTNTGLQGTNVELQSANSELQAARAGLQAAKADLLRAVELGERQRAELDEMSKRFDTLTAERDAVAGELQTAQTWIRELREAEAEFAQMANVESPAAVEPVTPAAVPAGSDERRRLERGLAADSVGQPVCLQRHAHCRSQQCRCRARGCIRERLPARDRSAAQAPPDREGTARQRPAADVHRARGLDQGRVGCSRASDLLSGGVRFTKPDEAAIEGFARQHPLVS